MPRAPTLAPPAEEESQATREARARPSPIPQTAAPTPPTLPTGTAPPSAPRPPRQLFADSLLDLSATRPGQRTLEFLFSLLVHTILLSAIIIVPLILTQTIDVRQFTRTFLVGPPPPPPPPPPTSPVITKAPRMPKRVFLQSGKLVAPTFIPEKIAMLREEPLSPEAGLGVPGGVPGGVAGGQLGGVIGGIISGAAKTAVPVAPPPPAAKAPLRVGGRVREPRLLARPDPIYPTLAKQAMIEGVVMIDAVIDTNGDVVEMKVLSGHPLLIPAALEALKHWKYEPTYLNEQPVSVSLAVRIVFKLRRD